MARELVDGVWLLDVGLVPPLATNAFLLDGSAADATTDGRTEEGRTDGGETDGGETDGGETDGGETDGVAGDRTPTTGTAAPVTLVDTGLWWNRPSLVGELAEAGYEPTDIDRVLLTHYDLDHVTGLGRLVERGFDGPVYMGRRDVELVRGEWDPPLAHHKGAFHRVARRLFGFPDVDLRPVDHGDRIGGFTAYHTPGHNHGHTVYVHEGLSVACLGDLVWEEGGQLTPPFWLDSYEMRAIRESIKRFDREAPDFDVAAMSHGTPFVMGGRGAIHRLAQEL